MPRKRSKLIRGGSKKKVVLPTVPAAHQRKAKELQQQHIKRAREDVNFFIEYCFEHYDKKIKKSFPLVQGWMHRQWQALMGNHDRLIIIAARGHGKTRQCVYRALWELGRDPNHIIKIICQSDAKAVKRLSMVRAEMRDNKRLHAVFPHLKLSEVVESNKHQVTVKRDVRVPDPSIEALGITSSASGDRATILLADDVVDRRNAITLPKVREQIKEAWDDWVNLLGGDGGVIWYIATLWHDKALTNELMANPAWAVGWYEVRKDLGCHVKLPDGREYDADHALWGWDPSCPIHPAPAIDDVDDDEEESEEESEEFAAIDPSKASELNEPSEEEDEPAPALEDCRALGCRCGLWTKPNLRKRRAEIGPRQFARGFSNRPMAEGEMKVNPNWIDWYPYDPPDDWYWYVSIDTAESQEAQAAWTGIVIAAVNPENGHIWIFDAYHVKLQFPDRVKLVKQIYREFLPELFIIERAGGGISLIEHLTATTSIPIFGMPTKTKGGNSKAERLESTTPRMAAHQILFAPELDPSPGMGIVNPERGDLITELLEFHRDKDLCDAFAHLVRYVSVVHPYSLDELPDEENDNMGVRRPRMSRPEDDGFSVTLIG